MDNLFRELTDLYMRLEKDLNAKDWALIARTVSALEIQETTIERLKAEIETLTEQKP